MKKIFCLLLILIHTLFRISPVLAEGAKLLVSPSGNVKLGDKVKVTITNIPNETGGYQVNALLSTATVLGGARGAGLQFITAKDAACTIRDKGDIGEFGWSSAECTGSGPFTFVGEIDTGKISADTNSTTPIEYTVLLGGTSETTSGLAKGVDGKFTIEAPKASDATFKIISILPDAPKPGETVKITLSGAKNVEYSYGLTGADLQPGKCSSSDCVLDLKIPEQITNTSVNIVVIDPDLKRQIRSINLTPKDALTDTIPDKVIPYKPCTPEEVAAGTCTKAAGIACTAKAGDKEYTGELTAIGCIPTEPKMFIEYTLKFILGLSGGIALLLMAFSAFQMITSQGNAEALKKANDQFYNAIIGLLFIIFAVMLLQVIGYNILGLPGFGTP